MSQGSAPSFWRPVVALALVFLAIVLFLVTNEPSEEMVDETVETTGVAEVGADSLPSPEQQNNDTEITADIAPRDISAVPIPQTFALSVAPDPDIIQTVLPVHEFETYTVQAGDTPNKIAETFKIQASTILGGNPNLSQESAALQVDAELVILPVDGVLHDVQRGDSLASIAEFYEVNPDAIIGYENNNLSFPYRLYEGSQLMIPGAEPPVFLWTPPVLTVRTQEAERSGSTSGQPVYALGTNTYVWPVQNRCISQFYWFGHPGIDVAILSGTPVVASDRGTVTWSGWAAGGYFDYGILVVINHGNGHETFYAHLSEVAVFPGQTVEQGQIVGYSGNTGRSSGPHLHFEIRLNNGRVSPFWGGYLNPQYRDCTGNF